MKVNQTQPCTNEDTRQWRSIGGEDCSSLPASSSQWPINQGLPVLHLGWSAPLWSLSRCVGPPSPTATALCHGPILFVMPYVPGTHYLMSLPSLNIFKKTVSNYLLGRAWVEPHTSMTSLCSFEMSAFKFLVLRRLGSCTRWVIVKVYCQSAVSVTCVETTEVEAHMAT